MEVDTGEEVRRLRSFEDGSRCNEGLVSHLQRALIGSVVSVAAQPSE
jgi:hypothetical protein